MCSGEGAPPRTESPVVTSLVRVIRYSVVVDLSTRGNFLENLEKNNNDRNNHLNGQKPGGKSTEVASSPSSSVILEHLEEVLLASPNTNTNKTHRHLSKNPAFSEAAV